MYIIYIICNNFKSKIYLLLFLLDVIYKYNKLTLFIKADKEKVKKKKVKKEEPKEAPVEEAPAPAPVAEPEAPPSHSSTKHSSRKSSSKKVRRSGSNVFSMFTTQQVAEFKEVI